MNACVIIPTYNEEKMIGALVGQVKSLGLPVIVIDDGSQDKTSIVAGREGAVVLRNPDNQGKGASLRKGMKYALNSNFDAVITMDGDGQHLPSDINFFLRLAQYSHSQVFIGNRMSKLKNMPWVRVFTNKFMSWLISKITKQKIPDTQCGFRLFKKEALSLISLKTSKYETESEALIRASRLGFRIESVPIKTVYNNEKSQINPFIDTLRFIRFICKEVWTTRY